jgi:hypothetical protein
VHGVYRLKWTAVSVENPHMDWFRGVVGAAVLAALAVTGGITYLVEPGPETLLLRGSRVRVYEDADGKVEIRHDGTPICRPTGECSQPPRARDLASTRRPADRGANAPPDGRPGAVGDGLLFAENFAQVPLPTRGRTT